MAKSELEYVPLRLKFDWERLETKMQKAGGIKHTLQQAGISAASWYNAIYAEEDIPVRVPIQKLARYFNMTAAEFREYFIIKPVKERDNG